MFTSKELWGYYDRWSTWPGLQSKKQSLRMKTLAIIAQDKGR